MNTQQRANKTPLTELLEKVPSNARLVIDSGDGMATAFIPVGRLCHEAASALRVLLEQPEQADEPVAWGNFKEDGTLVGLSQHPEEQTNWNGRKPLYTRPQSAAAIPEGYKLVPDTPTNEMTSAMADALEDPENERSSWDLAENMYRAMLAAAPQQKGN